MITLEEAIQDHHKLLAYAKEWCRKMPPYSKWFIADELWETLWAALEMESRLYHGTPAYRLKIYLRTVELYPKRMLSAYRDMREGRA